jgi:hypothetical protein
MSNNQISRIAGSVSVMVWLIASAASCQREPATQIVSEPRGTLAPARDLSVPRALHTVTRLLNGKLLVVGGMPEAATNTAELVDLATGSARALTLTVPRLGHTATLLPNGDVLIVGGGYGSSNTANRTAELFDHATESFRATGRPAEPRVDHAAVLLATGRVLIVGGDTSGVGRSPTAAAEEYDPSTGVFTKVSDMSIPRRPFGVVRLGNGQVLIAGGTTTNKQVVSSAEVYTPTTSSFTAVGNLAVPREKHTAATLADGRILIAGGSRGPNDSDRLATTEFYNPRSMRFESGPPMAIPRHKVASAVLPSGRVIVVGGGNGLAEVFDPSANGFFSVSGASGIERFYPAATALGDGSILITGGYAATGSKSTAWIYRP